MKESSIINPPFRKTILPFFLGVMFACFLSFSVSMTNGQINSLYQATSAPCVLIMLFGSYFYRFDNKWVRGAGRLLVRLASAVFGISSVFFVQRLFYHLGGG